MKIHSLVLALFFLITGFTFSQETQEITINGNLLYADLMYSDNFTNGLYNWKTERESGTVSVQNEKLDIDVDAGCTVWFKEQIEGAMMIEYDAIVIDEGGANDRISDLNCFWNAIDPNGDLITDTSRTGDFGEYSPLRLYYVGLGGNNNGTTRFRRYVGNGDRPLLPEHDLSDPEYLITGNAVNHIKIIVYEGTVQYYRNNQLIFDFFDENPYESGYFGLRTVRNHMTMDNFKVYRLSSDTEEVLCENLPTNIDLSKNYSVSINYNVNVERDIVLTLFKENQWIADKKINVQPGSSLLDINIISNNDIVEGDDYLWRLAIRPVDGEASTNIKVCDINNVIASDRPLSINNITNKEGLSIYPNPVIDKLTIVPNLKIKTTSFKVKVLNLSGVQVRNEELTNEINTLNVSSLTSGIYFLQVISGTSVHVSKFVKK